MVRTREQTEAVALEVLRFKKTISSETKLFEYHEKFFSSEAAEVASRDEIEARFDAIKLIEPEVKKALKELTLLIDDNEEVEFCNQTHDFLNRNFALIGKIKSYLRKFDEIGSKNVQQSSGGSSFKTPKIELPEFNGSIENWIHFRDMFISLVHDNTSLQDIQKYHFLRMSIKMPAGTSNVLDGFLFNAESYGDAWKAVKARYDDKRKIIKHHLSTLFNIKKIASGNSFELRKLIDAFSSVLSSISQQGFSLDDCNDFGNLIIVFMVTERLDDETLKEWRKEHPEDFSTWSELYDFLNALQRSLDDQQLPNKISIKADPKKSAKALLSNNKTSVANVCPLCSGKHRIFHCEQFRNMTVKQRHQIVKEKQLCINCLAPGHRAADCASKNRCQICNQTHNTLLHFDSTSSSQTVSNQRREQPSHLSAEVPAFTPVTLSQQPRPQAHSSMSALSSNAYATRRLTMLSTVSVRVLDKNGEYHIARALLDSGSDICFMTTAFAQRLNLEKKSSVMSITGINEKVVMLKHKVETSIKSRFNDFARFCEFSLMPNITGNLPSQSISFSSLNIPVDYHNDLADPEFHSSGKIDILLDNSVFWECMMAHTYAIPNGPTLRCTRFGWLIGGEINLPAKTSSSFLSCCPRESVMNEEIDEQLNKFFALDDVESSKPSLTAEEKYCETLYSSTTRQVSDGKYIVQMPFKVTNRKLGMNYKRALQQNYRLDAKRQKDEKYNELYSNYMNTLIETGIMSEVPPPTADQAVHYLPHHGVLKTSSVSTKLRPVFNASCKSETGISLNDMLCTGPTIQSELVDILMRFRQHRYVIMGDITKMYLQIWIHPPQRNYLRIVWRPSLGESVRSYQLNTVTFGTACAPYLAIRTLQQIADDNEKEFPETAQVIRNSFYVDDLLHATDSIDQAQTTLAELCHILQTAGMSLCKIVSNNKAILDGVTNKSLHPSDDDETFKALGIRYSPITDDFSFHLTAMHEGVSTKASVLSSIASIYDPMGWLGPVVLKAKLIMKSLWLLSLKWTDELPFEQQQEWDDFCSQFSTLDSLRIKRHCVTNDSVAIELHGFCDASIVGYGAVVYALSTNEANEKKVSIVIAKSRVAPKSQKTLARLELCAAVLLSKLMRKVVSSLTIKIDSINLWSDSMIVLHWITMTSSKLQTFVGNRVAVIQEQTQNYTWRHIRGEENPADVISRGLMPGELQPCHVWWNGPSFFQHSKDKWPETLMTVSSDDPEMRAEMKKSLIVSTPNDLFTYFQTRFSNLRTLINVFAFVKRFTTNARKPAQRKGFSSSALLTVDEVSYARLDIIRIIQREMFAKEYRALSNKTSLPKQSTIRSLAPFMDDDGILRIGGRLESCPEMSFDQKHPIILPQCYFTTLIIRDVHQRQLHAGPSALMSFVKQTYWPLRARSTIKKVIFECVVCFRAKPPEINQPMSDLPAARVTLTKPFVHTAIDYAGFFMIRSGLTRNAPHAKCYMALFKCMCTGAIHLELVSDLTSTAFIAALDRFTSRRGKPTIIFSDNGTCFHGADKELKDIVKAHDQVTSSYCINQLIKWQYTTPRAPHAGGIYEAGIKNAKHHLKRIMNRVFTFEQFTTILCKVEAVLNSRPLTPLSSDPADTRVLTPGHFLIGGPLNAIPQRNFSNVAPNRLKAWEGLQQIQQQFWQSWYKDYLHNLQTRPNNCQDVHHFKIGDMVLVKEPNMPPMKWMMGRIVKLFPSPRDKIVRNVRIITQYGEKDRHVRYLSFFPIENTEEQEPSASSPGGQCVPDGMCQH